MKKYQKPAIINAAYSPEPVEAGCCLRSCGGSPHHVNANAKVNKLLEKINYTLKQEKISVIS